MCSLCDCLNYFQAKLFNNGYPLSIMVVVADKCYYETNAISHVSICTQIFLVLWKQTLLFKIWWCKNYGTLSLYCNTALVKHLANILLAAQISKQRWFGLEIFYTRNCNVSGLRINFSNYLVENKCLFKYVDGALGSVKAVSNVVHIINTELQVLFPSYQIIFLTLVT